MYKWDYELRSNTNKIKKEIKIIYFYINDNE